MILDHISHIGCYRNDPYLYALLCALSQQEELPERQVVIREDDLLINPSSFVSKPEEEGKFEGHLRFADVHYILKGSERITIAPRETASETVPYDPASDIAFFAVSGGTDYILRPGDFLVCYPHELHRPGIAPDQPAAVEKLVGKLRIGG